MSESIFMCQNTAQHLTCRKSAGKVNKLAVSTDRDAYLQERCDGCIMYTLNKECLGPVEFVLATSLTGSEKTREVCNA